MMEQPARRQQFDLLVRAANEVDQSRLPPEIRAGVTLLLKLLMAECVTAGAPLSAEVANE
jgi:hypothetical protein